MKYEAQKLDLQDYINFLEQNDDIEIISVIYLSGFDRTKFLVTFKRVKKIVDVQELFNEHNLGVRN